MDDRDVVQNVGGVETAGPLLAGVLVHALGRQEAKTDGTDGLYRRCSVVGDDEANPGIGSAPDAAPVIQEQVVLVLSASSLRGDALRVVMPMDRPSFVLRSDLCAVASGGATPPGCRGAHGNHQRGNEGERTRGSSRALRSAATRVA